MDFADILKRLRMERGLSQDEMAALLGTTKQVISRYETRQRIPRISVVERFAERLGVPVSFLTGEVAAPAPDPAPAAPAGAFRFWAPSPAASRSSPRRTAATT